MNAHDAYKLVTHATRIATGSEPSVDPWITVREAAKRARCGIKLLYREVRAGHLKASRVGGRRELRLRGEWVDEWLVRHSTIR